ncbi:MAG: PEGA domain-containing protein [bacterium]
MSFRMFSFATLVSASVALCCAWSAAWASPQPGAAAGDDPRAAAGDKPRAVAGDKPRAAQDDKARAAEADKAKARKHFSNGSRLYAKGKFKQAIVEFTEAYRFWKNRRILLNIAICHAEGGKRVEAITFFRRALAGADAAAVAKLRSGSPEVLKRMEGEVAILKVEMPDPTAEIYINGKPAGKSPVEQVVIPGDCKVEVKVNGQVKVHKTFQLAQGGQETWALTSWPVPRERQKPPVGADKPGGSWRRLAKLPVLYFGIAAVVTLAGAAALIGTGVKTNQLEDDYHANPNLGTRDEGLRYKSAANAMIGITAIAAAATVALGIFTDWKKLPWKKKESASTTVAPHLGPGGAGLTVSGSF